MYEGRCSAITNVTTERALWPYDKTFLFNNKPEVDFGIAYLIVKVKESLCSPSQGLRVPGF
jgi:hypothetical protein